MPDEDYGEPRGTAPEAAPADGQQLPHGVIDNGGHYEVDRIVTGRLEYLYWVQRHFADRVLPPQAEGAGD